MADGNIAVMRAALRIIRDDARKPCKLDREAVARICKEALSAPARNCDRFANSHDAIVAFENEIDYLKEGGADYGDLAAWLFSKAEGGAE